KPLLAQTSYSYAGNLNIAQRVVDLATLPLFAIQEALWPRLFASDNHRRQLWISGALLLFAAIIAGGLLALSAPLLPAVLGPDFASTGMLIVWLSGLPALLALRNLINFHLIASGRTHLLTWIYLVSGL